MSKQAELSKFPLVGTVFLLKINSIVTDSRIQTFGQVL